MTDADARDYEILINFFVEVEKLLGEQSFGQAKDCCQEVFGKLKEFVTKANKLESQLIEHEKTILPRVIWLIDTLDDGESPGYRAVQEALKAVLDGRLGLPEKRVK